MLKLKKSFIILFTTIFISDKCYSQAKKHNADYYFQQANIKYQVPPERCTDRLVRQCIGLYAKAIELDPKFSQAYRNGGRLYGDLNCTLMRSTISHVQLSMLKRMKDGTCIKVALNIII